MDIGCCRQRCCIGKRSNKRRKELSCDCGNCKCAFTKRALGCEACLPQPLQALLGRRCCCSYFWPPPPGKSIEKNCNWMCGPLLQLHHILHNNAYMWDPPNFLSPHRCIFLSVATPSNYRGELAILNLRTNFKISTKC